MEVGSCLQKLIFYNVGSVEDFCRQKFPLHVILGRSISPQEQHAGGGGDGTGH